MNSLIAALQPLFAGAFVVAGSVVTWLELVAFVLALAMVVFNMRVDPRGWPLAIALRQKLPSAARLTPRSADSFRPRDENVI